jgi:hypothetical protein
MNPARRTFTLLVSSFVLVAPLSPAAEPPALVNVKTQADLDAVIASAGDALLKQALRDNAAAVLAAAAQRPHVEAIIRTVELSPGKVERINVTPESLKRAVGGDVALFDTLKAVDLAIPNAGPHDHRKTDPYDAVFFEHLGHITALESLNVIATKASDEWIAPLGKLTNLKTLRFTNNGKLTDAGMEHLAGLKYLEQFSFVGTAITGRAYAKCTDWTHLTRVSHRGSSIDDEGLQQLCEHLPNLESISLAHAKFTDAGAPHLAKLTKLKGLELGTSKATPQTLRHIAKLPLEYLQLGEGFDSPECIPLIKGIATLRRLTLTNTKALTDADLKAIAGMTQLEQLELGGIALPDERRALLKDFAFLKSLRLVPAKPFTPETQDMIRQVLPKVELKLQ